MSNYPDNVTGHEWQIAGPESLTVSRECKGTGYVIDFDDPDLVTDADCPFSGEVDAEVYDYELFWTCPVCGHENHEPWGWPQDEFDEPDDDPYPDDEFVCQDVTTDVATCQRQNFPHYATTGVHPDVIKMQAKRFPMPWPEVNWHEASPEDHKMYLDHAASIAEYRKGN